MTRVAGLPVRICAVAALIAGCTPGPRAAPEASGVRWELHVSPYRPAALQAATLRLRALDARGEPIVLQGFRATASMPGVNRRGETIAFREMEAGVYEALHSFSTGGRWEIHISGSVKGKRAEFRMTLEVGAR
jgi:hypothetical protein